MKAIINGKRYDTEKATKIARDSYNGSCTDFYWWSESLYRTAKGAFFLAGEGGPLSHYSRPYEQNGSVGGNAIKPLTIDEARQWCEEHEATDALEEHFQDAIQDA